MALAFVTILNTFLMNVGERRRQLAVLRAIGTTRRQLIHMLLIEGLAMGVVGTLLGTAAGLGGAYLLTQSMGKVYAAPMPALRITLAPFVAAGLLGPIVSLLAMFVPAWIAGRVSPLEGMRFVVSERRGPHPALVRRDRVGRVPVDRFGGGRLHRRLSAFADDDDRGRAVHRDVSAVDSDDPASAGMARFGGALSVASHRRPHRQPADSPPGSAHFADNRNPLRRRQHGHQSWNQHPRHRRRHPHLDEQDDSGAISLFAT